MRHSPLIPKSPAPKEQPAASRDSGTRVTVPKWSASHSGPGPPAGAVPQRPALGCSSRDSPAAPALPEPQLAGRCAVEARRGAPPANSPAGKRGSGGEAWAGGGDRESAGTRARAALRPAKVADPARGLAGRSRAQAFGAGTPRRRARGEPRRGERASGDRAEGAAYPARRRRSVLPSPIRPLRPPAAEADALPLSLPAARDHGDDQIHMESRFIKIHVKPPATYLYS